MQDARMQGCKVLVNPWSPAPRRRHIRSDGDGGINPIKFLAKSVRKNKKTADYQRFIVVDRGIEPLCQD